MSEKKRSWGKWLLGIVVVGVAGMIGCAALLSSAADEIQEDIEQERAEALEDVSVKSCEADEIGDLTATLTVVNNSSERSNYMIEVTFEAPDGSQLDTGLAVVNALEPGQRTEAEVVTATDAPAEFDCRVVEVDRFSDEP